MKYENGRDGFFGTALIGNNKEYDYLDSNQELLAQNANYKNWTITPAYENRPDLIAHFHYSDASMWRIIAQFNNVEDPFVEFEAGRVIKIPKNSDVSKFKREHYRKDDYAKQDFDRRRYDKELAFKLIGEANGE